MTNLIESIHDELICDMREDHLQEGFFGNVASKIGGGFRKMGQGMVGGLNRVDRAMSGGRGGFMDKMKGANMGKAQPDAARAIMRKQNARNIATQGKSGLSGGITQPQNARTPRAMSQFRQNSGLRPGGNNMRNSGPAMGTSPRMPQNNPTARTPQAMNAFSKFQQKKAAPAMTANPHIFGAGRTKRRGSFVGSMSMGV